MPYAVLTFMDDEDARSVDLSARDVAAIVQGLAARSDEWAEIATQEGASEGTIRLARDQQNHTDELQARLERADEGL